MKIEKKLQKSCEYAQNYIVLSGNALESADDLPKSWCLLKAGSTPLHKDGNAYILTLSEEDLNAIAEYHAACGTPIPLDSEHFLSAIAKKNGMDEKDVVRMFPTSRGMLGTCDIVCRDGALYAENASFSESAKPFIRAAALRYFSPVLRGLDGKSPLRMTSIALVSNPAIGNMEALGCDSPEPYGLKYRFFTPNDVIN